MNHQPALLELSNPLVKNHLVPSTAMSNTPQSLNLPISTPRPLTPPPASPYPPTPRHPDRGGIGVFSGGTAANFLVDVFDKISTKKKCPLRYIIPISDNGGSSSELIRVFGGPSKTQPHAPSQRTAVLITNLPQVSAMCEVSCQGIYWFYRLLMKAGP